MPKPAIYTAGDPYWYGLDTYHPAKNVPEGFCSVIDNLVIEGGQLVIRPGKQGQLTSIMGGAIYALTPIIQSDGTTNIWFAQGSNLYKYVPGGTSATQITYSGMPSLTAANVVIKQAAGYVYVCDNSTYTSGGLSTGILRFFPDGSTGTSGGAVTGLAKPDAPTVSKLSHQPLLSTPGTLTWNTYDADDPIGNYVSAFSTPTAGNTDTGTGKDWQASAFPNVAFTTFVGGAASCTLGGSVGTSIVTVNPIVFAAGTDGTYPTTVKVSFLGQTKLGGDDITSRLKVTLSTFSDTGASVPVDVRVFLIGLMSTTPQLQTVTFDCRDAADNIKSVLLKIENANSGIKGDDPMIGDIVVMAGGYGFGFVASTTTLTVKSGTVYASPVGNVCSDGNQIYVNPLPQVTAFYTRGRRFYTDISSTDFSQVQRIAASVQMLFNIGTTNTVPVKLYISNYTSGTETAANRAYSGQIDLTVGANQSIDFDITTADIAIRSAVTRIGFEFGDDVPIPDTSAIYPPAVDGGVNLLQVNFVTKPGNLSVDTSITYNVVEIDGRTDPLKLLNIIQSNGSDQTTAIIPTLDDAIGVITLAARKNSTTSGAYSTYFAIYRFGDFQDGLGRLLCVIGWSTFDGSGNYLNVVPSNIAEGADTNKGQLPFYAYLANPYIAVDFSAEGSTVGSAGIVVTDNTPSSFLFPSLQLYIDGRDAPPPKVRDIVEYGNRLWLLAGSGLRNEFYGSWLLSADVNAGLYFSRSVDPTDPNAPVKGFYDHIATEDNDQVLRMMPLDDRMVFLFSRKSPYIMLGSDPSNYSIRPFISSSGQDMGLSARNAAIVWGRLVIYLSPNGLLRWNTATDPQPFSLPIQGYLNPALMGGGTALNTTGYPLCSLWQQGGRIYLAAPGTSSDNANTVIFRFDPKEGSDTGVISGDGVAGAWVRWLQGNVTGGCALTGQSDSNGHYVGGLDGMIYQYVQGAGDKATAAGSITGIAFTLTTRQYGHDANLYDLKVPIRCDTEFTSSSAEAAGIAVTVALAGDKGSVVSTQSYNLALLNTPQNWTFTPDYAEGKTLQATVTATVKKRFVIGPIRLQSKIGSNWQQY